MFQNLERFWNPCPKRGSHLTVAEGCLRCTKITLGWKTQNYYHETDQVPNPRRTQLNKKKKVKKWQFGPLFPTRQIIFRELGLVLYRKQTTRNLTQPDSPQTRECVSAARVSFLPWDARRGESLPQVIGEGNKRECQGSRSTFEGIHLSVSFRYRIQRGGGDRKILTKIDPVCCIFQWYMCDDHSTARTVPRTCPPHVGKTRKKKKTCCCSEALQARGGGGGGG